MMINNTPPKVNPAFPLTLPSPLADCVVILGLSLQATEGSAAISLFSERREIASVVSLPRNDIVTQSLGGEG